MLYVSSRYLWQVHEQFPYYHVRIRAYISTYATSSSTFSIPRVESPDLRRRSGSTNETGHIQMDNLFIDALVSAGTYRKHARQSMSRQLPRPQSFFLLKTRRRLSHDWIGYMRNFSSHPPSPAQPQVAPQEFSQDDYKQMVDYYNEPRSDEDVGTSVQGTHRLPFILPQETEKKVQGPDTRPEKTENAENPAVRQLVNVLKNSESSLGELFYLYKVLPFPGVLHLNRNCRNTLLLRLSVVEKKNKTAMLRYMSVLDDMKAADLPLNVNQWSSAVHLVGRCHSIVTAVEVESALRIWKEMEEEAQVQSSHITFNILFDIAVKSGKFVLAEMILDEMKNRHLAVNRFAHVGMIYYHGLRHDGGGVRQAYRDFVEAGQIVDTVVLNCVIASLLRAGELPAAEQVFQRMKVMHGKRTGLKIPSMSFRQSRELGRILDEAAIRYKKDPKMRNEIQREQSLSPDIHTYVIFLEHHVSETGDLEGIANLFDDMQLLDVPIHGRLFMELFRGFSLHGGVRYTSWTPARLESVWSSYMDALEISAEDIFVGKWMAIWTVRAFVKCCGKKRSIEIWDELRSRWKASEQETSMIYSILVGE